MRWNLDFPHRDWWCKRLVGREILHCYGFWRFWMSSAATNWQKTESLRILTQDQVIVFGVRILYAMPATMQSCKFTLTGEVTCCRFNIYSLAVGKDPFPADESLTQNLPQSFITSFPTSLKFFAASSLWPWQGSLRLSLNLSGSVCLWWHL